MCPWFPPKAVTGFDCRVTAELRSRVSCLRRLAHTTKKMGWLFKESNLVLFSKRSAIKPQPLTILIRSPAPVRPQVLTVTPMWKKTHAADDFLPVHPVGMAGFEPATSCSQSRRATKLRHIPKTDVQVKGCTHILIPHDLNHKQQPQSGIKPVFPVHV